MDEDDFLRKFITSEREYRLSDAEEQGRYNNRPPYHKRMIRWIDKFYTPFRLGFKSDGEEDA